MEFTRLDNRRLPAEFAEVEAPTISVTKSYAKLSPGAASVLNVSPGDFVGFHVNKNGEYAVSKAVDEKGGKKLSANLTLVSESIYKRLKEGVTYVLGQPVNALGTDYYLLSEQADSSEEALPTPEQEEATHLAEPVDQDFI